MKGKCSCSRNKEKKDHWLDYAVDDYGVSILENVLTYITKTTAIYSLGHGLHTLTVLSRSTTPSTLHGTVK